MIYKLKGRKYYRVKFMFKGEVIHKCTRATDAKTARSIESKIRSELARGNWGILELKPALTLGEFLKKDFLSLALASPAKPKRLITMSTGQIASVRPT